MFILNKIPDFYEYYKYAVIWKDNNGKERIKLFRTRKTAKESIKTINKAKIVKINAKFKQNHIVIT